MSARIGLTFLAMCTAFKTICWCAVVDALAGGIISITVAPPFDSGLLDRSLVNTLDGELVNEFVVSVVLDSLFDSLVVGLPRVGATLLFLGVAGGEHGSSFLLSVVFCFFGLPSCVASASACFASASASFSVEATRSVRHISFGDSAFENEDFKQP